MECFFSDSMAADDSARKTLQGMKICIVFQHDLAGQRLKAISALQRLHQNREALTQFSAHHLPEHTAKTHTFQNSHQNYFRVRFVPAVDLSLLNSS